MSSIDHQGVPLLLLSPRACPRYSFLSQILEADDNVILYSLTQRQSTLRHLLEGLCEGIRDFYPKFEGRTLQALSRPHIGPADLATHMLQDLTSLKPTPQYLVLEDWDHLLPDEDTFRFLQSLLSNFPPNMHLVISGRFLPLQFWSSFIEAKQVVVIGEDLPLDEIGKPLLVVDGFSRGTVLANGMPIATWDGPLSRNLFYFLIDHSSVTRDEIFEAIWPDLATKEATNVFHVTKRKIAEKLGFDITAYLGGFYRRASTIQVRYEVETFETLVERAAQLPLSEALPIWEQAVRLYRVPFLYELEIPWIVRRREQLKASYAEALMGIARCYRAQGNVEQAIPFYRRAGREFPEREDICRDLMELYRDQGHVDQALACYQALESRLDRSLGIRPAPVTQHLYKRLVGRPAPKH